MAKSTLFFNKFISIGFKDFLVLTKFRLSLSVVVSSVAGYLLAVDSIEVSVILLLLLGGCLTVGASNAFNQWMEKELDAKMNRTKNRPLPQKRITSSVAMTIATLMTVLGCLSLYLINIYTSLLALLSLIIYLLVYTPLKTKTPLAVFFGAFPGAIPFMLGWIAATGNFGIEAGTLFAIQFFWQFPHFWSIAWIADTDYQKAGFRLLPTGKRDSGTVFQIVFYTLWMIVISIFPATNYTGDLHLSPAGLGIIILMGLGVLYYALKLMANPTTLQAKPLIRICIVYITMLQLTYVIDKFVTQ
ncbi:MAG: heme o synthase [Flavobacteriaceae bacterium]|nr:heme o synthase [Flavobacteriaceae bacterium]